MSNQDKQISYLQAFKAMQHFLEKYYEQTHSDDIGSLLGDMELDAKTIKTRDPAAWSDWIECIKRAQKYT